MSQPKRALAIHDLSCLGKCSLTIALPVLSAAGVETAVLPTSVLSTHTGGFGTPVLRDLTDGLAPTAAHWKSFGASFDALYAGYLASAEQVEGVLGLFDDFGANALKLVDPVMGDNGRLYSGFPAVFPQEMKKLCARADIIVPNFTEAALLLDEPYMEGPHTETAVISLLHRLTALCPGDIVLTGVSLTDATLGAAALERKTGAVSFALAPRVPGHFHGTGDLFASALLAALLAGRPLGEAAQLAADFTSESVRLSASRRDTRYGVCFESALPFFMRSLNIL